MKFFILFFSIIALSLNTGCMEEGKQQINTPPAVTVVMVQSRQVSETLEAVARTKATAKVQIRAQVTGIIKSRIFEEGAFVNAGDLLLEINPAQFEADLAVAAAAVAHAKASQNKSKLYLARLKGMRAGSVAAVDLDAAISDAAVADANLRQMEAQWQLAKLDLDHSRITAPISGLIGENNSDVGNLVSANGDTLATIVQSDPIETSWSISERFLTDLKSTLASIGKSFSIDAEITPMLRLSNGDIYPHQGEVFFLDNEVNPQTGTVTMRARFPNPDGLLIPGQFVTVLIQPNTEQKERLLIPQASVQQDMEGYYVLVVRDDNTIEQRRVLLGSRFEDEWIVQQGLDHKEKIIYMGLEKVRPGITVNPVLETGRAIAPHIIQPERSNP